MKLIVMIKKVIRTIKGELSWYISLYRGKKVFDQLCNNTKYILVLSHGIGDIVWSASFLGAYIQSKCIPSNACVFCMKRDLLLLQSYYPSFEYITVDKKQLIDVGRYVAQNKRPQSEALIFPRLKKPKVMRAEIECFADIGMEMDSCYRRGCFQLTDSSGFIKPNLFAFESQADYFIKENNIVANKTVILIPYINSRLTLSFKEWEKIASRLIDRGYNVYTNVSANSDTYINGSAPLFAPLEILPLVIKKSGYAIAGRCGLADWIYVNECRMSIIHTYKNEENLSKEELIQSKFGKLESFHEMSRRCGLHDIKEYRLEQNKNNDEIIEKIVQDVDIEMRGVNSDL